MAGTLTASTENQQAAAAFEALLALDPAPAHRAELRAAGVSEHRIEALYPLRGFVALEPGLIAHVGRLSDEHLLSKSGDLQSQASAIWNALPPLLDDASNVDSEADDETAKERLSITFNAYLCERFTTSALIKSEGEARIAGFRIGQAAWAAHWFMTHRAEIAVWDLKPPISAAADRFMLSVARTLALGGEVG